MCGPYSLPVFCFVSVRRAHILTLAALIFTCVLSVMVFSVLLNAEGCWQWEGRCALPSLYLSERIHTSTHKHTHTRTCQRGRFESMVLHGEACNGVYFDTSAVLLNWVTLTFLSPQHRQCNLQDLVTFALFICLCQNWLNNMEFNWRVGHFAHMKLNGFIWLKRLENFWVSLEPYCFGQRVNDTL